MTEFYRPKAEWGNGPWQSEPDEDSGTVETPYITLPAKLMRNASGSWCGYVGVPQGHPLHGKSYDHDDLPDIDVHGGLTFAGYRAEGDDHWYFGFDCSHAWDYTPGLYGTDVPVGNNEVYRTIDYAREQCDRLGAQIGEYHKGLIARFVTFVMESGK